MNLSPCEQPAITVVIYGMDWFERTPGRCEYFLWQSALNESRISLSEKIMFYHTLTPLRVDAMHFLCQFGVYLVKFDRIRPLTESVLENDLPTQSQPSLSTHCVFPGINGVHPAVNLAPVISRNTGVQYVVVAPLRLVSPCAQAVAGELRHSKC